MGFSAGNGTVADGPFIICHTTSKRKKKDEISLTLWMKLNSGEIKRNILRISGLHDIP